MIVVISGTNRPGANTRLVSGIVEGMLREGGIETRMVDLADLPLSMFAREAYAQKPPEMKHFVDSILGAGGILTVVPEYNGSFPGVLKYFIDMLPFPDSLVDKPCAFVGLSSGRWGAVRAVEQLKMVFQYRHAHIYGRTCYLPTIGALIDGEGRLTEAETQRRLRATTLGFASFCDKLAGESD